MQFYLEARRLSERAFHVKTGVVYRNGHTWRMAGRPSPRRRRAPTETSESEATRTFRTTVSLPAAVATQVQRIADFKRLPLIEIIRLGVEQYAECETSSGVLAHIPQLVDSARGLTNHYQSTVAEWRLQRATKQLAGISKGQFTLDTHSAETYLLLVMADLQGALGAGDECSVVTTMPFWENAHAGADRGYLHEDEFRRYLNEQGKAVGRGMRLNRVIVLGESDLQASSKLIRLHADFLDEVRSAYPDCAACIQTRIKEISSKDDAIARLKPFACIRRVAVGRQAEDAEVGECFIVEPRYNAKGHITEVRLIFSKGPGDGDPSTRPYFDRFQLASTGSVPIEELSRS